MKKALEAVVVATLLAAAQGAWATPSTVFWTPATTYTQPYLVPHLTLDTYFNETNNLPIDGGLTVGLLPFEKLQAEAGFDFFLPVPLSLQPDNDTWDLVQLNGKVTLAENAFGSWSPGLSVGVANAGFKHNVSDYHLVHATLGKTTPIGIFGLGGYYGAGSKALWTGSDGVERGGFQGSWVSPDIVLDLPGLQKIIFMVDGASGENWFGAIGGGIGLYFTPAIDVLTGPVFFNDTDLYGSDWMWTVQLDVDIDLMKKKT
jgi:hypothetical protein